MKWRRRFQVLVVCPTQPRTGQNNVFPSTNRCATNVRPGISLSFASFAMSASADQLLVCFGKFEKCINISGNAVNVCIILVFLFLLTTVHYDAVDLGVREGQIIAHAQSLIDEARQVPDTPDHVT